MDNFNYEPIGQPPMVQTAENVAKKVKGGVTKEFADAVTLETGTKQYLDSLKDDRAFQKKIYDPRAVHEKARRRKVCWEAG